MFILYTCLNHLHHIFMVHVIALPYNLVLLFFQVVHGFPASSLVLFYSIVSYPFLDVKPSLSSAVRFHCTYIAHKHPHVGFSNHNSLIVLTLCPFPFTFYTVESSIKLFKSYFADSTLNLPLTHLSIIIL